MTAKHPNDNAGCTQTLSSANETELTVFRRSFIQYGDTGEVILRHRHFYYAAMIFFNIVSELKRDVSGRCHSGLSGRITSCERVMVTFPSCTAGQTNHHSLMRGRPSHHLQKVGVTNRIFSFVKWSPMPEKILALKRIDGLKRDAPLDEPLGY